jgi:Fe-S-cluster-containing dehydrogenase component
MNTSQQVPHYVMVIDNRICVRCKACTVACRAENDVPRGHSRNWVSETEVRGSYPNLGVSFEPGQCMQCANPHCVRVCPVKATTKDDDGVVRIDSDICIGCRYCMEACPYDARYFDKERGVADKCDYCTHRILAGGEPSCVATCPSRARVFGDLNDSKSEVARLIATHRTSRRKVEAGTEPQIYYIDE